MKIKVFSNFFCDGHPNCNVNYEDETASMCRDRYFCQAGARVNIAQSEVCDGTVDCNDASDENRTTCPDRFFCKSLNGAKVAGFDDIKNAVDLA